MSRAALLLVAACGGATALPPAPPSPPPAAAFALEPPGLRLPRIVLPTAQRVEVVVDPASPTFTGRAILSARAREATPIFWLHAEKLTITEAKAIVAGRTIPLEILTPQPDTVGLRADASIPAGELTVELRYHGLVDDTETEGLFHQREGDAWYAFTSSEPTGARRIFPCFDEPDVKIPWELQLDVPEGLLAAANAPIASETALGGGQRRVRFKPTRPLPSYLVAFAVGPFDAVDAGRTSGGGPVRVLAPRGRGGHVAFPVATTVQVLARLEAYFGTPYPYEKLDLVAIPQTVGFGAMENPGLVTYEQSLLVARPEEDTVAHQRACMSITAHELAHQWFGDLVTLAWWNDIWLNESFAEWMRNRTMMSLRPEWNRDVAAVRDALASMRADGLRGTRPLRKSVTTRDDVENAITQITYSKGAAVLAMFERWLGEDRFRDGVRAYLGQHTDGNATAADFFVAIGATSGRDVGQPMSTFLDQAGVPLVSFELVCARGAPPALRLAQERYVPTGEPPAPEQRWEIPVCVRVPQGTRCTLLTERQATWTLGEGITGCPAYVIPSADGVTYQRSQLEGDLLQRLLRADKELRPTEVLALISDVGALVNAGRLDVGVELGLVDRFAGHASRHVVAEVTGIVDDLPERMPEALRPRLVRFIASSFGPRARKLGWTVRPTDDGDTAEIRRILVPLVATVGEDRALAAEARRLALAWIADRRAVPPELIDEILYVAAYHGGPELYERFVAEARKATDRQDRRHLLDTLGSFRDPELVTRGIGLLVSGEFDSRELWSTLFNNPWGATARPRYEAVKAQYDAIVAKVPRPWVARLVSVGVALCDAAARADVEAFFKPRNEKVPGGAQSFARAMERMDQCIQRTEAKRPGVERFLAAH